MDKETILLFDIDGPEAQAFRSRLSELGYPVEFFSDIQTGQQWYIEHRPPFVMVNTQMPGGVQLVVDIRLISTDVMLFAMASADRLGATMKVLKESADEFLSRPVDTLCLEIALHRAAKARHLILQVRQTCQADRTAQTCDNVAREVANERFLVVRQIIEKMSVFIAQIASSVEGGVKYFNELPYFVSVHSADCRVLAANATALKFLGNRIYANSWEIYAGKRATREACPVGRTVRSGNVETTGALVNYKSGAQVPVMVHTAPIYDNEGEVALVLEVFAGTQEIDQLAEQVRHTNQRYQHLFEAVPVQVVVLDLRHTITAVNRRFKELFGDQIGKKFNELFTPAAFTALNDPISLTFTDGLPHQGEMALTGPDGKNHTVMARTSPIVTVTGKMVQVLAILSDITEYRQMKDSMATVGLMLSTVCHDMKGCITGLDAGHYLVEKGFYRNLPGRIEEGLDAIRLMGERLRKLVFGVLYNAKDRSLELEPVEVLKFAGGIAAMFETRIRGAAIEFNCDFDRCDGEIEIDAGLLRSALSNIMENAVEACIEDNSKQRHHIDFSIVSVNDNVIFRIKDNGPGISEEEIEHLFNLFHSSKGCRGTGLGLYITEKAVSKHGGHIDVTSTPSDGTVFSVSIPRRFAGHDE